MLKLKSQKNEIKIMTVYCALLVCDAQYTFAASSEEVHFGFRDLVAVSFEDYIPLVRSAAMSMQGYRRAACESGLKIQDDNSRPVP